MSSEPPESDLNPMELLPAIGLPEHPYERIARRRFLGLIIVLIITIICSILVIYIIYQNQAGAIENQFRTLGLLVVLIIWFVSTSMVSKAAFGKFGPME